MSDAHTPTTEEVREAYPHGSGILPPYYDMTFPTTLADRHAAFDRWLAQVKADTLREAATALNKPAEGATYDMWSSDAGSWLRARADRIEGKTDDH